MIERKSWVQLQPLYRYVRQQAENKKFLKYIEITATFVLITLFLFFAIKPTATAISKLLGEISSKQLLVSQMKSKINSVLNAQNSYSEAQAKYQVIESSLPSNPMFYQAYNNLYSMSNDSSIKPTTVNFDLSTKSDSSKEKTESNIDTKSFGIKFSGNGSYSQILSFIKKAVDNRRLTDIKSIQLSQPRQEDNLLPDGILNVSLSGDLFYSSSTNEKN